MITTPHKSPLKLAVFDCDGTIVDSQHSIIASMHGACEHHGFEKPTAEAVRRIVGLPLEVAIQRLMEGVDHKQSLEISETYKSVFRSLRETGDVHEPLFPGVVDVFDQLETSGWLLGIATGKAMRGLKNTLGPYGLLDRFVTQQTADLALGKPNPEMLINAMNATGVDAQNTVMIGDTTFDIEMAVNAGVKAIGVTWGYHPTDELKDAGAACVVDSADALARALLDPAQ